MPSSPVVELVQSLRDTIARGDGPAQDGAFQRLDLAISDEMTFDDDCFTGLLRAVGDSEVGAAPDSARLIKVFEYNRDLLEPRQQARLFEALESCYGNYVDPAASMLMLELVVDGSESREALGVLQRLAASGASNGRALLPYGLQYLYKKANDVAIREAIGKLLAVLASDRSPEVRDETSRARARIDAMSR